MRKTTLAMLFAATLPTLAMAMPQGGPEGFGPGPGKGGPGPRGGEPFAQLDLTHEQRTQVGKLMGEERHQQREITKKYLDKLPAADRKAMEDEIKANHDKAQADVRAVLKPEQQKQFDEMKKKEDQHRAEWAEFQAWKAQQGKKTQ